MPYKDKQKQKEYNQQYRLKNKEKLKEQKKEWKRKNPEKVKAGRGRHREHKLIHDREYYHNNKVAILEQMKSYRLNNKDKIRKRKRKRYETNKETILQKQKEYYRLNKTKILERCINHYKSNSVKYRAYNRERYYSKTCPTCGNPMGHNKKNCKVCHLKNMTPWNKGKRYTLEEYDRIFTKQARQKRSIALSLENHPNWQGGKSFEPYTYDFNDKFKESVRARDNHLCVICNKPQNTPNQKLNVHHIDYNKLNSFKENCVSLCDKGHGLTNFNRESWKLYFRKLLFERYGYAYEQEQTSLLNFSKITGENLVY